MTPTTDRFPSPTPRPLFPGGTSPGRRTARGLIARGLPALAAALLVAACAAGAAPPVSPSAPGGSPTGPVDLAPRPGTTSPPTSPGGPGEVIGTALEPPVETAAEAVEAVGFLDGRFLGYGPRRDDAIGQTSWVDVTGGPDLWTLVFTTGQGDCMAGCIDRAFAKFTVAGDGTVRRHCEWTRDDAPDGQQPC